MELERIDQKSKTPAEKVGGKLMDFRLRSRSVVAVWMGKVQKTHSITGNNQNHEYNTSLDVSHDL